jgi:hypothetical protein
MIILSPPPLPKTFAALLLPKTSEAPIPNYLNNISDVWTHVHHPPCVPHPLNGWIPIKYFVQTNKIHMFRSNPHTIPINPIPIPINAHVIKLSEPL